MNDDWTMTCAFSADDVFRPQDRKTAFSDDRRQHSTLKIVVGRNAARISGVLQDANGEALTDRLLLVYLVQDPEDPDSQNMVRVKGDARYKFTGLRPGKYRFLRSIRLTAKSCRATTSLSNWAPKSRNSRSKLETRSREI
jgi:hypothetical protein